MKLTSKAILLSLFAQTVSIPFTMADELEILEGGNSIKPNVIFILDASNSVIDPIEEVEVKSTYGNEWAYTPAYYNPIIDKYLESFKYIKKSNALPAHRRTKQQIEKLNWQGYDSGSEGYGVKGGKTEWVQNLPKINLLNDIVREMVYLTSERGGVNLSIMATSINHAGFEAWYEDKKSNVRISNFQTEFPNENGSYVLEAFQDTSNFNSADAMVENFFSKGIPVASKFSHGYVIRETENNIHSSLGTTPLSESLLEAYYYFTGQRSLWNKAQWGETKSSDEYFKRIKYYGSLNKALIDDAAYENNNIAGSYKSPWDKNSCGENHVIFYTDGNPSWDWQANNQIVQLTGSAYPSTPLLSDPNYKPIGMRGIQLKNNEQDTLPEHSLMDELARHLYESDLSNLPGKQNIHTHIVTTKLPAGQELLLSESAKAGGGVFVNATDFSKVLDAIKDVYKKIAETKNLSGYKVLIPQSASQPLKQSDDVYLSFFGTDKGKWVGNIKKYKYLNGNIIDKNQNSIFKNGVFDGKSIDLWNEANKTDGTVSNGGVVSQLDINNTNRFTFINNQMLPITSNQLKATDFQVNASQLNAVIAEARKVVADSVHVKPVFFNYYRNTNNESKATLFLPTNSGFLHAFDASSGIEQMAFIPQEFLPNIAKNLESTTEKIYGLDGGITLWHDDLNKDHDLLQSKNGPADINENGKREKLYLYASAGRGGAYMYGLDVSDVKQPKLQWKIDRNTNGFSELGNTWSKPIKTKISFGDKYKDILLFGNGDQSGSKSGAIYMVNAENGRQEWRINNTKIATMKNNIISEIKILDYNFDGLVDAFFALDVKGQIFRCDVTRATQQDFPNINCGRTAELDPTNQRLFYNNLDLVVMTSNSGIPNRLALAVGSGNINQPNEDTVQDKLYVIFDKNPLSKPNFYTTISANDLSDATTNPVLENAQGWYINLIKGEKVLTDSLTLNNNLIFQTYLPGEVESTGDSCTGEVTASFKGKLHVVNIATAKYFNNLPPINTTFGTGLPDDFTVRQTTGKEGLMFTVGVGNNQPQSFEAPAVRPIGLTDDVLTKDIKAKTY